MKFIDIAARQVDVEAQRMLSDLRDVRVCYPSFNFYTTTLKILKKSLRPSDM